MLGMPAFCGELHPMVQYLIFIGVQPNLLPATRIAMQTRLFSLNNQAKYPSIVWVQHEYLQHTLPFLCHPLLSHLAGLQSMEIQLKQFRDGRPLVLLQNQHLFEIIRALQQTQSYAEIVQVAEKMTESAEKYLLATNALLHLKQWHRLIQACDMGLKLADESEFHHLKGKALIKLNNFPQSIEPLRMAVFLNGNIAAYHRNLAAAYYHLKRYEQAAGEQERTVQLEPDNATNHHNLATTLYRLGRYQQAEMAFAYAIKINPKQPLSYSWHGDCLKMLGRYKQALEGYSRAYELSGNPTYLREREKMEDLLRQAR